MKPARALWQAGAVLESEFDGRRLRGRVKDGARTFAAGLLIQSPTDVQNLCPCPESRRSGTLCLHSLALGLAWVHGKASGGAAEKAPRAPAAAGAAATTLAAPGPLKIVLPGGFFEGLRRARLVAVLEKAAGGDAAADRPLLEWLAAQRLTRVPPNVALQHGGQIDSFLQALQGHPRVESGRRALTVVAQAVRLRASLHRLPEGEARLAVEPPAGGQHPLLPLEPDRAWWLWDPEGARLFPLVRPATLPGRFTTTASGGLEMRLPLPVMVRHLDEVSAALEIDPALSDPRLQHLRRLPGRPQFLLKLDGSLQQLSARLLCRYAGLQAPLVAGGETGAAFPIQDQEDEAVFYDRNIAAEVRAVSELESAGFVRDDSSKSFRLKGEPQVLQFVAGRLPELRKRWQVEAGEGFAAAERRVEVVSPRWQVLGSGQDWLAFDLTFTSESGIHLSTAEVRQLLERGRGHRRLPDGRTAVVPLEAAGELEEVLKDVDPRQEAGHFRVRPEQAAYLATLFGAGGGAAPAPPELPGLAAVMDQAAAILRPYQAEGVRWMAGRAAGAMGGVLADEMGLGKTLQALAVLRALHLSTPGDPLLVVCPKSLLGNWRQEAERFFPGLPVRVVRSGERQADLQRLGEPGLVITSYQLLARDIDHYRPRRWGAVFLDEASLIRNPDTAIARAVRSLEAGCRFALSGTPIENSVRDLWSLMEFAVPGYLGRRRDFQERYEAPLDGAGAGRSPTLERLRRRMQPFWLRRTKQEVARDLPEKIETVIPCELNPWQRELYRRVLDEGAEKVRTARRQGPSGSARLTLLTALLRLRQTCCDPRLMGLEPPAEEERPGKLSALRELLEEIRDGGHNVLIFSQFARMLRLIEAEVAELGMGCSLLDGSTRDREKVVGEFMNEPQRQVFLISLKAGGYGLNLTKADTVIHFDPWWNPAVEAQATDRAHRIGQSRPVNVYKLITTGTVEEKILRLQRQKRGVMDAALDDATPLMDGLSEEELRELLGG